MAGGLPRLEPGMIVTVSFPFADLSALKRRPALVLIRAGEDLVVCGVTSKRSGRSDAIRVENRDMVSGRLPAPSEIRPLKLVTLHPVACEVGRRQGQRDDPREGRAATHEGARARR